MDAKHLLEGLYLGTMNPVAQDLREQRSESHGVMPNFEKRLLTHNRRVTHTYLYSSASLVECRLPAHISIHEACRSCIGLYLSSVRAATVSQRPYCSSEFSCNGTILFSSNLDLYQGRTRASPRFKRHNRPGEYHPSIL